MGLWTLKLPKARPTADGKPGIGIATPNFGCKSSISIVSDNSFPRVSM
jgi:hypothetical protein